MKWMMGWVMGLGLSLSLAACTVPGLDELGPFACQSASDCVEGYACVANQCVQAGSGPADAGDLDAGDLDAGDPDAGATDAGGSDAGGTDAGKPDAGPADAGPLDTTPPTLTLSVPTPFVRAPSGKTVYAEPGPDGSTLPTAFRRDQEVVVELRTDSPLPIALSFKGTDGKPVTVSVTPYTSGCSDRQCARATLQMWKPQLSDSRGAFIVTARVEDEAGNATVREASAPVTRFKWAYTAFPVSETDNSLDGPPAIGARGMVYLTTYSSKLTALDPDGQDGDRTTQGEGIPVLSTLSGGRELAYVRVYDDSTSSTYLASIDTSSGATVARCPESPISNLVFGGMAITNYKTTEESVMGITSSDSVNSFYLLRSYPNTAGKQCLTVATSTGTSDRGNVVVSGSAYYFSDKNSDITSVAAGSGGPRSGWPVAEATLEGTNGMVLASNQLVIGEGDMGGTGKGGISVMNVDAPAKPTLKYSGGAVVSPVLGTGGTVFGVDRRGGQLVKVFLGSTDVVKSTEFGLSPTQPPTLGQGGLVYAMYTGQLGVFSASNLALLWKWGPGVSSKRPEVATPVLDCTRDASGNPVSGRPGVLYAAIRNRLVALVVDSAGLDADAPWPKLQHDERNTGNKDASILRCP